jgi:hypothetical protein
MSDVSGATEQQQTPPPPTNTGVNGASTSATWYEGKVDPSMIGYLQNKGWDKLDAGSAAAAAAKAHFEAQKLLGGPADQLIRLPKDAKDVAGWNALHQRLGKPSDPKQYDFTDVKFADGTAIDETYADVIRKAAWENNITQDAATGFAQAMVAHGEQTMNNQALEANTRKEEQIANIHKSWGPNFNQNNLTAMEGANRVGISQEDYNKAADAIGWDKMAQLFLKIGLGTREDTFHEGNRVTTPTVEAAVARRNELMQDKDWVRRVSRGDSEAIAEKRRLDTQIAMSKGYEP